MRVNHEQQEYTRLGTYEKSYQNLTDREHSKEANKSVNMSSLN